MVDKKYKSHHSVGGHYFSGWQLSRLNFLLGRAHLVTNLLPTDLFYFQQ